MYFLGKTLRHEHYMNRPYHKNKSFVKIAFHTLTTINSFCKEVNDSDFNHEGASPVKVLIHIHYVIMIIRIVLWNCENSFITEFHGN